MKSHIYNSVLCVSPVYRLRKKADSSLLLLSSAASMPTFAGGYLIHETLVGSRKLPFCMECDFSVNQPKSPSSLSTNSVHCLLLVYETLPNISIERLEEFKYLGTTLTDKNSIQEEIKSRLKLGNACYYSVQNLLSSSLLSKKLKIKIYRTIILPVVLYGCEAWSLTFGAESFVFQFAIQKVKD